ncbi:mCG148173 [Mus musculus]|jgi:hypothetical protein|nr:mCG148173 [Mus musculus]
MLWLHISDKVKVVISLLILEVLVQPLFSAHKKLIFNSEHLLWRRQTASKKFFAF